MSQLCLKRNFVPEPIFKCSLPTCCLQELVAFSPVQPQSLWPQAVPVASSKTSSPYKEHRVGGGQYKGAGMGNLDQMDIKNGCRRLWNVVTPNHMNQMLSSKQLQNLHNSSLLKTTYIQVETYSIFLVLNWFEKIDFILGTRLSLNMSPCILCLQLPDFVLTSLCVSGQHCATKNSENRIIPPATNTWECVWTTNRHLESKAHSCWHISQKHIAVHQF